MLSEKPWKPDSIIYLVAALMACVGMGSLFGQLLLKSGWLESFGSEGFVTVLISTVFLQVPVFLVVAWFVHFSGTTWRKAFGFKTDRWRRMIVMSVGTTILGLVLSLALSKFSHFFMESVNITPQEQVTVTALRETVSIYEKLLFAVVAILIAPVVEELLFRGILYPTIKQLGYRGVALWGTSILFGLIHQNVMAAISLTILSVLLILLYEETDNLMAPIISHSLFNTANYLWLVYYGA